MCVRAHAPLLPLLASLSFFAWLYCFSVALCPGLSLYVSASKDSMQGW